MFCINCGEKIERKGNYCQNCGIRIEELERVTPNKIYWHKIVFYSVLILTGLSEIWNSIEKSYDFTTTLLGLILGLVVTSLIMFFVWYIIIKPIYYLSTDHKDRKSINLWEINNHKPEIAVLIVVFFIIFLMLSNRIPPEKILQIFQ